MKGDIRIPGIPGHHFRKKPPLGSFQVAMEKKNHRLLSLMAFLILGSTWGCATPYHLSIDYVPTAPPSFTLPGDRQLSLSVETTGGDSGPWYRMGACSWVPGRAPSAVVKEAVSIELKRMGISISGNPGRADGRIKVKIRWFGPYGYNPSSTGLILSVSLYKKGSTDPLWHDKLEAGSFPAKTAKTMRGQGELMEKSASDALARVVRQLSWRPGFVRSISRLSRPVRPRGGKKHGDNGPD